MALFLPRQFKVLSEILREGFASIQKATQEQINAMRVVAETANETRKDIPVYLSDLVVPADVRAKEDTYRKKAHRQ